MSVPVAVTTLRAPEHPRALLLVGPSLGTAVTPLWSACARALPGDVLVVGWELPGHGGGPAHDHPFTVADLAAGVLAATAGVRSAVGGPVVLAGVSLGGAVALTVAVEHPDAVDAVAVVASGARIGEPAGWHERADLVRRAGTPVVVEASARRWFAPGSLERDPAGSAALLDSLQHADAGSYARCCEALASYDVRGELPRVRVPVLVVAGEQDRVATAAMGQEVADGTGGRLVVLPGAAHLPPAEQPDATARELADLLRRLEETP